MRSLHPLAVLLMASSLAACIGSNKSTGSSAPSTPTLNTVTVTIDGGPSGATGQINHAYVTLKVCAPASQTECATIDHVLLDTGSTGLRLVRSVVTAGGVALSTTTDTQGQNVEECVSFGGGQTWGPVVLADVTLAGEKAAKLPLQLLDDTATDAPAPATCGAGGTLINAVAALGANGVLGVGVLAEDCGTACVAPTTPLPVYYGCATSGTCSAENIALGAQVANPVSLFVADNNGIIVSLPALTNANGDSTVQGELTFGIGTQSDNAMPAAGLTVLGADANGYFTATYNGGTTVLKALIDSGTDSYALDDSSIATCASGSFVGYFCPAVAPLGVFAVNMGVGAYNGSDTVDFAIADPSTFVAGAAAFASLGSPGGSGSLTWGMPFFYGRTIYFGIAQRTAGSFTGPFYAY